MPWLWLLACKGPEPASEPINAVDLEEATAAMTDLGARLVGTPGESEAARIVGELFTDAGLQDVHDEEFVWDAWVPGPATITAGGQSYPAEPLSPTPTVHDLVLPLRLPTTNYEGDAVLVSSADGSRAAQFWESTTNGAEAMIRVSDYLDFDGTPLVEVGHTLVGAGLVSLAVDQPTGDALRAHVGEDVTIDADTDVLVGHTSVNVLGEVPGTGADTVYVVAHYDSWHPSESAFDNALGVGALVVIARKLAAGPPPEATVIFLATSGEEQGLQGALAWVDQHPGEAAGADAVLNLDVVWSAEGAFVVMASEAEWVDLAIDLAADRGLDAVDGGPPNPSSDHFAFMMAGAPTIWCGRWDDRHYHSQRDTLAQLDFEQATSAVWVNWGLLADVARVPDEP
jgi:hypothetical protein